METIDLNKVAGFQALDNEGNVLGIVSMEQLTDTVAMRIAESLSGGDRMLLPATEPMAVTAAATGSDKMETALGETTDPAYVRVIDKSGNSAKQGISSLATVVGGLIEYPFQNRTFSTDFNNATKSGVYILSNVNNYENSPGFSYGLMVVFANYYIQQMCINSSATAIKTRINVDGTWTAWATISL